MLNGDPWFFRLFQTENNKISLIGKIVQSLTQLVQQKLKICLYFRLHKHKYNKSVKFNMLCGIQDQFLRITKNKKHLAIRDAVRIKHIKRKLD